MPWSLTVGKIAGTAVRIHVTFLLFLIWIWAAYYRQGGTNAAWEGVAFVVLLFLCVLLHEFGHVFAAKRYGVNTPDITLWPFGGIANLERIPEKPREELVVAIAGPLVSVLIAALLVLLLGATIDPSNLMNIEDPKVEMASKLASANVFLVLFNMVPAFPMDGGRVLRALLGIKLGFARATELAASIGQGLAISLGLIGIFTNPMLVIIAIFVFLAAAGEAGHVQLLLVARGALVADAMITKFESLGPQSRVQDAVEELIHTTQKEFPIVDGGGHLRGVLTRDAIIRALQERGADTPVIEVMDSEVPSLPARSNLETALKCLTEQRKPMIGATDSEGRLVGLLTIENLGEMMMVRSARASQRFRPWGRFANS
jgi:Zn-dependent protease/CBS domain-containing protein